MPRFQLHGHLRDAKFRASQSRDHPPLMELKSVRDLLNMCDQDLSRYVLKYFKYYGDLDINTGGGTDDVPKDRVDKLQKRIQDWKEKYGKLISETSIVIHGGVLNKLDERLQEVADKGQIPPGDRALALPHRQSPKPRWTGFSKDKEIEKLERAWYMETCNRLEEDGGYPLIDIGGLREYKGDWEMLAYVHCWRFALGIPKDKSSDVFEQQLATWEFFRRWQRYNRGLQDMGGFEEFAIHSWRKNRFMGTEADYNDFLEDIRTDSPSVLMEEWEQEQILRAKLQKYWREDCESFDDYGAAVERRLAKHGIHKTFKPDIDARSQDPVTTWIEYLGHMCWILDVHKEHQEEMLAENELYVATLTFDDRSLDRDDPNWEANLQKAQKGLDQAKESCQRLAARGQSKGSIFWQPHDLRDMNSMVSCTRGLIQQIKNQLRDVEYEARVSPSPTETSHDGTSNTAEQNAAVAIQEGPEDATRQPAQSQQVLSTQPTSPLDVPANPTSRSLKLQRKREEDEQKAREEEAKKAKEEEEAKKARAEERAMNLQAEREKKLA
ncbi:unnamed protein product [Clonostachys chloroleuca]|uniref:Uncharacterized protein n=1 Tax=Clonostachys chloroleuca TaxID=1926264 RepID=A0AA35PWX5_9HYPO|nr:unnamed protein product [Clonostachys chloroleuca]